MTSQFDDNTKRLGRRQLLRSAGLGFTGLAASALVGCGKDEKGVQAGDGDGPLELTTLRLPANDGYTSCGAPFFVAKKFLIEEEGFTNVEYVWPDEPVWFPALVRGEMDFIYDFAGSGMASIPERPLSVLGGIHVGCYQLIGREGIQSITEVKRVAVLTGDDPTAPDYAFMAQLLYLIGLDARQAMVTTTQDRVSDQLRSGEIDAVAVIPPLGQYLHALGHSNVILDSVEDTPFSQYFCCLIFGRNEFVTRYPAATKRFLRAVMKASDFVAAKPEESAKYMVENGHVHDYEETLAELRHIPYNVWRRYNVEDAVRFNALRMREAGIISATPDEILKRGVNLRYFNELREEMAMASRFDTGQRSAFDPNCDIPGLPTVSSSSARRSSLYLPGAGLRES